MKTQWVGSSEASILDRSLEMYEEVAGLMDYIEYGFDTLGSLTDGAIIHRGIYEDANKDKLVTYTLVSGLKRPAKRIEGLKKFLKK